MNEVGALQRVFHNEVVAMGQLTAGVYSKTFKSVSDLPQHSIAIAITGSPTGVVSVRARPVGGAGFTKIAIENIDLAAENMLCWSITGFFDAFALVVTTGVASGSIQLLVSSCVDGL